MNPMSTAVMIVIVSPHSSIVERPLETSRYKAACWDVTACLIIRGFLRMFHTTSNRYHLVLVP